MALLAAVIAAGAGPMFGGVATSHAQVPDLGSYPPEITLNPTSGPVGIRVAVMGRYWQGLVEIYWGSTDLRMGSAVADSYGKFSVQVQIPTSAEHGDDYTELIVARQSSSSAGAPFMVDSPNDPQPHSQTSGSETAPGNPPPNQTGPGPAPSSGGSGSDPPPPNSRAEASARSEAPSMPAEPDPRYYDGRQPVPVEGYRPPSSTSTGGSSTSAQSPPPPSGGGGPTSPAAEPARPPSPDETSPSPDEPTTASGSTEEGDEETALSGDHASSSRDRAVPAVPALLLALAAAAASSFATAAGIRRWRKAHASPE